METNANTINDIIEFGINDLPFFKNKTEALTYLLGKEYKRWDPACWPSNSGPGKKNPCNFRIWFVWSSKQLNGKYLPTKDNFLNILSPDGTEFIYEDLNMRDDGNIEKHYKGMDLLFIRNQDIGLMKFVGVFINDFEKYRLNHFVSKRIGTTVKLSRTPYPYIELMDDIKR